MTTTHSQHSDTNQQQNDHRLFTTSEASIKVCCPNRNLHWQIQGHMTKIQGHMTNTRSHDHHNAKSGLFLEPTSDMCLEVSST